MAHAVFPSTYYAVVVVQSGDRFLLVQEAKHEQTWYFPAGHLEVGESFVEAARREVREEAGIAVQLQGLLRVEHDLRSEGSARVGAIFLARPAGPEALKNTADEMSLQAAWATLPEIASYPVRGPEVGHIMGYVLGRPTIYPIEVLQLAGTPFTAPAARNMRENRAERQA